MKKIMVFVLSVIMVFSISYTEVGASEKSSTNKVVQKIGNEELEVTEDVHSNYKEVMVTSSKGDVVTFDTRDNFILENGHKIQFSVQMQVNEIEIMPMKLPDWRQIRAYTMTIKMEKALDRMTVSAITAFIRGKGLVLKIGKGATFIAKRLYTRYREKSLRGKKAFYVKTIVYGYIFTTSREAYKKLYQDLNKKSIPDTTTYSDSAIKGK